MTDEQLAVLDAGLRMLQEAPFQYHTIEQSTVTIIMARYPKIESRSLGRRIVAEAIARIGYFSETP